MAHVQLVSENGETHLIVDGTDITDAVLAEGFSITPAPGGIPGEFRVNVTLRADRIAADIEHAVVKAMKSGHRKAARR